MKTKIVLSFLLSLFLLSGCKNDSATTTEIPPEDLLPLQKDSVQSLTINNFQINVDYQGSLYNGIYLIGSKSIDVNFLSGLWVGMEQGGNPKTNIIWTGCYPRSNYSAKIDSQKKQLYLLDAGKLYNPAQWPISLGAPIDNGGKPKIYGDKMAWLSLHSDSVLGTTNLEMPLKNPLIGLRVNMAVFGYQRSELSNVLFIRYEITNTSASNWTGVYLGFFADNDLGDYVGNNATGYDSSMGISYTYAEERDTSHPVTGYAFLKTPKNVGTSSHRIMRKNSYIDPDFGESTCRTSTELLYALKGLSNTGAVMINPVTGQSTAYAFTGDPTNGTEWLDSKTDVRSLLSSGPFNLAAGETQVITLAWVVNTGISLKASIDALKAKFDLLKTGTSYWNYF